MKANQSMQPLERFQKFALFGLRPNFLQPSSNQSQSDFDSQKKQNLVIFECQCHKFWLGIDHTRF